jgi:inhibitor of cysteine peptidase
LSNRAFLNSLGLFVLFILPLSACELGEEKSRPVFVETVDIEVNQAADPPQYFAVVSGHLPDACSEISGVDQNRRGQTIDIEITSSSPEGALCAQILTPIEETISLDLAGLLAGQYTVNVNGTVTTLTLLEDHT